MKLIAFGLGILSVLVQGNLSTFGPAVPPGSAPAFLGRAFPYVPPRVRESRQLQTIQIEIEADRLSREGMRVTYEGNVEIRYGTVRLQADRVVYNEATEDAEAVGNVLLLAEGQRFTGRRAWFSFKTGQGTVWEVRGFTDRTPDGTRLYIEAARVDRIAPDTFVISHGRLTSCEERVPTWSFTTRRMTLRVNERVSLLWPAFRVKGVPILVVPYASVPVSKRVRNSGFLLPGFSNSNVKGISLTLPYYQTLGRSADITPRFQLFSARGVGYGADLRWRTREDSSVETGFFIVHDRLFGPPGPNQGGSAYYMRAVQYFPMGFVGTADVSLTSSFAFRQVFSDNFQQAVSPEERIQVSLSNNFGAYSFNMLLLSRDVILPQALVTLRQLPSFMLSGRPQLLSAKVPVYFSFDAAVDGIARKESTFRTPSLVQRFDMHPRFTFPILSLGGMTLTPELALRATFYSESADPQDRTRVRGQNWTRRYAEASVNVELPVLERDFHHHDGRPWFRHLIESTLTYRRIVGIGANALRAIRIDERDTVADTHEVEYAMTHRFLRIRRGASGERPFARSPIGDERSEVSGEAEENVEWFSIRIAQKYFFDPRFGGALHPDQRNQLLPIYTLSGFSFGGRARRFSPIRVSARAQPLASLFADVRFDYDPSERTIRAIGMTAGIKREAFAFAHTWYRTNRLVLPDGRGEPGTFSGNLYQASFMIGNMTRGLFVGADVLYDFTDRTVDGRLSSGRLISSSVRVGYGFTCCQLLFQNTTFKVGVRSENRFAVALVLNGIGSFGSHTAAGRRFFEPYSPF